jgi:hypothetical protein
VNHARPWRAFRGLRSALIFNAFFAASACAADSEFSQQVFRINPVAGEARPSETLENCLEGEFCQTQLLFALGRIDGDPGRLADDRTVPAMIRDGETTRYRFAPPKGQRFCRAELVKLSVAPSFGANAASMRFEVDHGFASVTVRLPKTATRAWFDGILILIASASDEGCTLTGQTKVYACKGRCETVRF